MKILQILFICTFAVFAVNAQNTLKGNAGLKKQAKAVKTIPATGFETLDIDVSVPPAANRGVDVIFGSSYYDLQTNNSIGRHVIQKPNGELSSVWTQSLASDLSFGDRGSGYNTTTSAEWGGYGEPRVENVRTGFTTICMTADGTEHVFSHEGGGSIHHSWKAEGATTWTQATIPNQTTPGGLWARSAASGNTIHVIYLTTPTALGGAEYQGMDGKLLYCRSTDAGASWDIVDAEIPGISSDTYLSVSAEEYAIDANGSNVAIGLFKQGADIRVFNSTDNGDTWSSSLVQDFIFDLWEPGLAYDTTVAIAAYDTTVYPYPVVGSMLTSDGSGDVLIDNNGVVHCFFSSSFIIDNDFTDTGWSYYPGSFFGIQYWNSTMDENNFITCAGTVDLNNDGEWGTDVSDVYAEYGWSFNTHPNAALGNDGNIYLVYSSHNDLDINTEDNTHFRKPFICRTDGDFMNWTDGQPVADESNSDAGFLPYQEIIYASIAREVVDGVANVVAQVDYAQGTNLNQDTDTENFMQHYRTSPIVSTKQIVRNDIELALSPNPAADQARIQFALDNATRGNVSIFDLSGRLVFRTTTQLFQAGSNSMNLNLTNIPTGIYMAQLNTENFVSTTKLVVSK